MEYPRGPDPATLAEKFQGHDIDLQELSPLYNKIPTEIRNLIFEYAFTEHPTGSPLVHDFAVQLNHDEAPLPAVVSGDGAPGVNWGGMNDIASDWARPDCSGSMAIPTDLLCTCKRIYLEAYSLPIVQKEFRFYFYRGPKAQQDTATQAQFEHFFNHTLTEWSSVPNHRRLDLVRSVRLFAQMFWLEDRTYRNLSWICSQTSYFSKVESLRITFRRGDWWWWENNALLGITPFRGNSSHPTARAQMRADMETTLRGDQVPFTEGVWGLAFERMPKLKTLVMDFETSEDKKAEMEKIVEWAQQWKFPAASGSGGPTMCFSAAGMPVQRMSWRGMRQHWSESCTACNRWAPRAEICDACAQRSRLRNAGYGPRLLVWTLTWRVVRDDRGGLGGDHGA